MLFRMSDFSASETFSDSSASLRAVMSLTRINRHCSPLISMISADSSPSTSPPFLFRNLASRSRTFPFSLSSKRKRVRTSGVSQILSSSELRPMASSRRYPVTRTNASLTSMYLPSAMVLMLRTDGVARKALANFSSDSRSASSTRLRWVMSLTRLRSRFSPCRLITTPEKRPARNSPFLPRSVNSRSRTSPSFSRSATNSRRSNGSCQSPSSGAVRPTASSRV